MSRRNRFAGERHHCACATTTTMPRSMSSSSSSFQLSLIFATRFTRESRPTMVDTSPGGDARILSEPSPGHVVAGYRLDARKPLQLGRGPVPLHGRREGSARGHALLGGRWCQRCRRNYFANNTNKPVYGTDSCYKLAQVNIELATK